MTREDSLRFFCAPEATMKRLEIERMKKEGRSNKEIKDFFKLYDKIQKRILKRLK